MGEVNGLRVLGGKCDDFIDTFEFIGDWLTDYDWIKTKKDFLSFYNESVIDVCVARDRDNNIVSASYILLGGYRALNFTGYNRLDFRSQKYSIECARLALQYYFETYDLVNRIDICFRNNDRVVNILSTKLGFSRIGVFPKLYRYKGVDTDYCYSTILRK